MKDRFVSTIKDERQDIFRRFTRFLKDNGAYSRFFAILKSNPQGFYRDRYRSDMTFFFNNSSPREWLNDSIVWALQVEGTDFWRILHIKWSNEYRI